MKAAQRYEVGNAVKEALSEHPVRLASVRRKVRVFVSVPGHVIERVPGRRQRRVEVADDVLRLQHVEMLEADGRTLEVIDGRSAIGVDVVDNQLRLVFKRLGDVIEPVNQLARLLRRQVLDAGAFALMPPIRLWICVPRVPNDLPRRIGRRRHDHHLNEWKFGRQPSKARDGFRIAAVRYRYDPIPALRIIHLGQRDERRAHRRFEFAQHRVKEHDIWPLALGFGERLGHIDPVDGQAQEVRVDDEREEIEHLGDDEENYQDLCERL